MGVTLAVLRHYVLQSRMESGDMATYWLPLHCFMGRALRSGHIPGWDPYAMGGMPFAPDAQAGWLSLPAMAFFWVLGCGAAIRWLMVALTATTGLGLYWFLRGEGASRVVASVGGVALAIWVAGSAMPPTFRFPGAIAFTTLLLGAVGRYIRAPRWSVRIVWLTVAALCFGQLAAAYLGLGLFIGVGTLLAYLVATLIPKLRSKEWSVRRTTAALGALGVAFLLVNVAYFLPRIAYTPRTTVGLGYGRLDALAQAFLGQPPTFPGPGAVATWPLNFSLVPGRYLGGVLVLSFAGLWSSRRRLVLAFAAVALVCYVASLQVVVDHVPKAIWSITVVDQYLHRPHRTTFGLFIPMAVLAAFGVEAWRRTESVRKRLLMLAPGVIVWLFLPLVFGAPIRRLAFLVLGGATVVGVLALARRVPLAEMALVPVIAVELMASTLFVRPRFTFEPISRVILPLPFPKARISKYLTPTPIAKALQERDDGRYMTLGRTKRLSALQTNQGVVYGIESTGGYLSVQVARYWLFVRALTDMKQLRQYAFFAHPPPIVLDLLQVNWIVAPNKGATVEPGSTRVVQERDYSLFRRPVTVPRASALFDWQVVSSSDEALRQVSADGFPFASTAILERDPGIVPAGSASGGTVTYASLGPQAARVEADVTAPAIILIRNVFDPNWHAQLDGHSVPLLAVDSVVQGVAVPPGHHTILLSYDDPTIGLGLLGSSLALAALGGLYVFFRRRERSGHGRAGPVEPTAVALP